MRHNELVNLKAHAARFREMWNLEPKESINFQNLMNRLKVITVFKVLGNKFSGMSINIDTGVNNVSRKFILINSSNTLGRQHFTLCHELYHLFIQEKFDSMDCTIGDFNKENPIEFKADWFAAFLLLPEDGILSLIPDSELSKNKISLQTIIKLEQFYSCSRRALLRRLDNMGLIKYEYYETYTKDVKTSARSYLSDLALYEPTNTEKVWGNYAELAHHLFNKEYVSETNFISLLKDIGIDIEKEISASDVDQ